MVIRVLSTIFAVGALCLSGATAFATDATFSSLSREIFSVSCMPCHSADRRQGDVDLTSYDGLVKSDVVVAGNPAQSLLYTEVFDAHMPLRAPKLADDKIEAIRAWIEAGAQNN